MEGEVRRRRDISFDLYAQGLKELNLDSATTYKTIRKWFKKRGFEHDQLSGYISKDFLTRNEAVSIVEEFMRQNPKIAACVEGFLITEVESREEVTNKITEFVNQFYPEYADIHERALDMRRMRNGATPEDTITPETRKKTKADAKDMMKQKAEKLLDAKKVNAPSHKPQSH